MQDAKTAERRAAEPAGASRGVFVSFAARRKDCSNDESWTLVCRGELASGGRAIVPLNSEAGRPSTIALVSSRPHTVGIRKAALEFDRYLLFCEPVSEWRTALRHHAY